MSNPQDPKKLNVAFMTSGGKQLCIAIVGGGGSSRFFAIVEKATFAVSPLDFSITLSELNMANIGL